MGWERWSNPSNKAEETSCVRVEQVQPDSTQSVQSKGTNASVMILHVHKSTQSRPLEFDHRRLGVWVLYVHNYNLGQ